LVVALLLFDTLLTPELEVDLLEEFVVATFALLFLPAVLFAEIALVLLLPSFRTTFVPVDLLCPYL
jgi:hypothetical protein